MNIILESIIDGIYCEILYFSFYIIKRINLNLFF